MAIRPAARSDVGLIFSLICELAAYERQPDQVTGTPELLEEALFGPHPWGEAVIAECAGEAAGFALFHSTFSTWECRPGIWLEDLFVPARHRRSGVGRALLTHLANLALDRGCARIEWAALDWNRPALDFYARLGAARLKDWQLHRLDEEGLMRLARADSTNQAN